MNLDRLPSKYNNTIYIFFKSSLFTRLFDQKKCPPPRKKKFSNDNGNGYIIKKPLS